MVDDDGHSEKVVIYRTSPNQITPDIDAEAFELEQAIPEQAK